MKIFKDYTFHWWQISISKMSLLCFGAVIGAYWHEFFTENMAIVLGVGILLAIYVIFISLKQ